MSAVQDILMPQLGQAMMRGTVIEWCATNGDVVTAGSHLLTIESDKFTYEIETPSTGILQRLVEIGDEADIGTVLGRIGAADAGEAAGGNDARAVAAVAPRPAAPAAVPVAARRADRPAASPKARAAAAGRIELAEVPVSRRDGLIVAADVERAIAAAREAATPPPDAEQAGGDGAIARLQRSWQQAPHFVQMVDVDATMLAEARRLHKAGAFPATLNDVVIWAAARALAAFPAINARIRDGRPVRNAAIDISLAVATDRGLRTPAIRDAGGRTIDWVAARSREAIAAASAGCPSGGPASLTISNLGAYGVRQGTPVLNVDEAVLIFVGAVAERPYVRDGAILARPELTLSVAFDHRIADGLQAARFTARLREELEGIDLAPWRGDRAVAPGTGSAGGDPVRQLLAALLACVTGALKAAAVDRGVSIAAIEGSATATPDGAVDAIGLHLAIRSSAAPDAVRALVGPAVAASPVRAMLRSDLTVTVTIDVQQAEAAA